MSNKGRAAGRSLTRMAGELALIFLGITAALGFEDLNAARHERILEAQILAEMTVALERDISDLQINVAASDSVLQSIETVLSALQGTQTPDSTLDFHFGMASRTVRFFHNPAAYEHLRSAGFDVVSNDALRGEIISYYDGSVATLRWVEEAIVVKGWSDTTVPAMLEKFEYSNPHSPAVPLDYDALREDVGYQNVLRFATFGITNQHLGSVETLSSAQSLLQNIRLELSER